MKKWILIPLIVLLILCVSPVLSESKELTFQGVPWGSSPNDAIKSLTDAGFVEKGRTPEMQETQKDGSSFFSHIGGYKKDKNTPYRYVYKPKDSCAVNLKNQTLWSNRLCTTIAKQDIRNVSLMYVQAPDGPQLTEVCIWFDDKDSVYSIDAVYDALVTAYGKPDASRKGKEYVWLGANNTVCILYNNDVVFASLDGLAKTGTFTAEMKDTGF